MNKNRLIFLTFFLVLLLSSNSLFGKPKNDKEKREDAMERALRIDSYIPWLGVELKITIGEHMRGVDVSPQPLLAAEGLNSSLHGVHCNNKTAYLLDPSKATSSRLATSLMIDSLFTAMAQSDFLPGSWGREKQTVEYVFPLKADWTASWRNYNKLLFDFNIVGRPNLKYYLYFEAPNETTLTEKPDDVIKEIYALKSTDGIGYKEILKPGDGKIKDRNIEPVKIKITPSAVVLTVCVSDEKGQEPIDSEDEEPPKKKKKKKGE